MGGHKRLRRQRASKEFDPDAVPLSVDLLLGCSQPPRGELGQAQGYLLPEKDGIRTRLPQFPAGWHDPANRRPAWNSIIHDPGNN
jgi:hypothetical protein